MGGDEGVIRAQNRKNFFSRNYHICLKQTQLEPKLSGGRGGHPPKSKLFFSKWLYVRETKAIQARDAYGVVGEGLSETQKFLPRLKIGSYEMKCDCVLVCILARGKSHIDINVMIWNCYLKSGFFLIGFQ
jgi:hypothetical protein